MCRGESRVAAEIDLDRRGAAPHGSRQAVKTNPPMLASTRRPTPSTPTM
jgi:hypothetical protein